jgi:hypothetical protein
VLDANRQLLGAHLHLEHANAHIKVPHPDRHTRAADLRDLHGDAGHWHRGLRPKWGTFPHDTDPRLINCTYMNNITYLTAVSPGNGSTAVLDGSHKLEGTYQALMDRCAVVEVPAPAGSILVFTESLWHTAVPILSETVRYNMYYGFVPPWYSAWPRFEVPQLIVDALRDEELRAIFSPSSFRGQYPEI